MGLFKPNESDVETARSRARQHLTRAEQLDREGKFDRATVERRTAERWEQRAAKITARLTDS